MALPFTLPCCAMCCAILSTFGIVLLVVIGGLLMKKSESIEIETEKMKNGSYASFIVAGIYATFLLFCSSYLFYYSKIKASLRKSSPLMIMEGISLEQMNGSKPDEETLSSREKLYDSTDKSNYQHKKDSIHSFAASRNNPQSAHNSVASNVYKKSLGGKNSQSTNQSLTFTASQKEKNFVKASSINNSSKASNYFQGNVEMAKR